MGACYSKKASGGNNSFSSAQMASTKLEETSRLARPTPYTRTSNANLDYGTKKSLPLSTKYQNITASIDQNEIKNIKNTFQSNIPRFSSSLPTSASTIECKTGISNCNENETLHVVNNNANVNSHSASSINNVLTPTMNKTYARASEIQIKPKSIGSKSCPDKILSQEKYEEKSSRIPGKSSGISRPSLGKSAHSLSHINTEVLSISKFPQSKEMIKVGNTKTNIGGPSPTLKSPYKNGFNSHDSLSDFDSGLGSSLIEKNKTEDSDTIKDLEQLELQEESLPGVCCNPRNNVLPKSSRVENVKPPLYKREPNGKWSFDFKEDIDSVYSEKNFNSLNQDGNTRERSSYKMNASENIFSTYASYKGLLSYQKKSFKNVDNVMNAREKLSPSEKMYKINQQTTSCIPKIKKPSIPTSFSGSSTFYVDNDSNIENEKSPFKISKPNDKSDVDSKHSSQDSDDKSDTTENGVFSPPSEVEREFLIDDEISDQPGLIFFNTSKSESEVQSLQQTMTELHALQLANSSKKRTDSMSSYSSKKERTNDHRDSLILGSDLGSSCSSIASDDLMLDYEKTFDGFPEGTVNEGPASPLKKLAEVDDDISEKIAPLRGEKKFDFEETNRKRLHRRSLGPLIHNSLKNESRLRSVSLPLRPPRPLSVCEAEDGSLKLDSSSYRLLCQDLNGVKTLLLRLKSVIQEAETINPFDQTNPKNIFYHSLVHNDLPSELISSSQEKAATNIQAITQVNFSNFISFYFN